VTYQHDTINLRRLSKRPPFPAIRPDNEVTGRLLSSPTGVVPPKGAVPPKETPGISRDPLLKNPWLKPKPNPRVSIPVPIPLLNPPPNPPNPPVNPKDEPARVCECVCECV